MSENIVFNILILCVSMFGLWIGASYVVESASSIAKKFGLSDLVIGLTIVAIATSAPEFAVSISAALRGQSAISVGNVIGSNIFNLGIILGFVAIMTPITITKTFLKRDATLLVAVGIILLIFFYDLTLSRIEGFLLFSTLLIYIFILIKEKADLEEDIPDCGFNLWTIPKLIFGVVIIIASANFLVDAATVIARFFGVSEWLIGITIVAAGTSLPELATSVVAVYKKQHGISVGNLIGSDLFNMLGVLGAASFIRPLSIESSEYTSLIFLSVTLIAIFIMMRSRWKISKFEGILLFLIALFRWSYDFIF